MDVKQSFVDARLEQIGSTIIRENTEYQILNIEVNDIYKEIRKLLPPDKRGLLLDMDIKYRSICAENEKIMYKQGVIDGIKMAKE